MWFSVYYHGAAFHHSPQNAGPERDLVDPLAHFLQVVFGEIESAEAQ